MIPNIQPYPKYKDSGVEWLGQVPVEWEVLPNRTLFQEIKDSNHPEEPLISVTISKGIIKQSDLIDNTSKKDSSNEDKTKYKLVKPGDIAYNKMRAWQGAIGISDLRGIVSPAYIIQRPRRKLQNGYFHYLLRTPLFAKEAERWSYGITSDQWSLRSEHFKMIYCSLPPIEEQSAIVRYLNYTSNRIQQYITSKHKLIKLLEEQKQAIIHQAVTGAIDVTTGKPYPKYKESGVKYLKTLPEEWEMVPFKRRVSFQEGPGIMAADFCDEGIPLIRISCIKGEVASLDGCNYLNAEKVRKKWSHFRIRKGDYLLSASASTGSVVLVTEKTEGAIPYTGIIRLWGNSKNTYMPYVKYLINSSLFQDQLDSMKSGVGIEHFGPSHLNRIIISMPGKEIQQLIVNHIRLRTSSYLKTIDHISNEVALLKEYQTRLTADVVTGKADVRELAKNLPTDVTDSIVDDPNDDYIENTEMITEVIEK